MQTSSLYSILSDGQKLTKSCQLKVSNWNFLVRPIVYAMSLISCEISLAVKLLSDDDDADDADDDDDNNNLAWGTHR